MLLNLLFDVGMQIYVSVGYYTDRTNIPGTELIERLDVIDSMNRPTVPLTETDYQQISLDWFAKCGHTCLHGPDIAPHMPGAERFLIRSIVMEDWGEDF